MASSKKAVTKQRRILSAYDAYWFLYEHPRLNRKERTPLAPEEVEEAKRPKRRPTGDAEVIGKALGRRKGYRIIKDKGGNWWKEWDIAVPAITENLDIHYATVDERGVINDDQSKNVHVACWLECGEVAWSHHYVDNPEWRDGERDYLMHYHDIDLDCGGKTFDEALIKLARKVLKKYGDFPSEPWQLFRPRGVSSGA